MLLELALVMGSLVLVDDVARSHPVQERLDFIQHLGRLLGVFGSMQLLDHRPHLATGGAVAKVATFGLANALDG